MNSHGKTILTRTFISFYVLAGVELVMIQMQVIKILLWEVILAMLFLVLICWMLKQQVMHYCYQHSLSFCFLQFQLVITPPRTYDIYFNPNITSNPCNLTTLDTNRIHTITNANFLSYHQLFQSSFIIHIATFDQDTAKYPKFLDGYHISVLGKMCTQNCQIWTSLKCK